MQVQYFMTPDPKVVSPDETVDAAWDRMASIQAHHLPVVEDGVLIGIISDRDLRDDLDGLVRDVMTREPITVRPEGGLIEAGKVLLSNQINAVPVSRQRRRISRKICACTVTSNAVVGSSAMIKSGSFRSAVAMTTRCRIPPENWCG